MKIYIYGSVGSGKTTYARSLGKKYKIPYYSLDDIIYKRVDGCEEKRDIPEQIELLKEITQQPKWIVEGAQFRIHFLDIVIQEDVDVLILNPPYDIILFRIVSRWIRQRNDKEASFYSPNIKMLKNMLVWSLKFQKKKKENIFYLEKISGRVKNIREY